MKKDIAIIFGGKSSEHDISCKSAVNVVKGLNEEKYNAFLLGITKSGKWLFVNKVEDIEDGSWEKSETCAFISPDASIHGIVFIDKENNKKTKKIDVAIPVLHGLYGEDGTIQGLFELAGIPYVGSGVCASSVGMDKISTKLFADKVGVKQAAYVTDVARDDSEIQNTIKEAEEKLGYPVFVKPSNAGSSQGVSKATNKQELEAAIRLAKKHDHRVLIEENINGREIECAVLGGKDLLATKVGEIISAAEFYDFDAKYNNDDSKTIIDPDLDEKVKNLIRENALKIFKSVDGYGLSRVDFFVEKDSNEVIFNEINTLPGFTNISMYPMLCEAEGLNIHQLLDRLIELAEERENEKNKIFK